MYYAPGHPILKLFYTQQCKQYKYKKYNFRVVTEKLVFGYLYTYA